MIDCTVIIPYDKDRGYLSEAVESVEKQTKKVNLILSQGFQNKQKNINKGLKEVKTKFVKFLDEDDILLPNGIEILTNNIKKYMWCYANAIYFYKGVDQFVYRPEYKKFDLNMLLSGNIICNSTVLYNMDIFDKVGLFDEDDYLNSMDDFDYHMRCLLNDIYPKYINETVSKYRFHKSQISRMDQEIKKMNRKKIIDKNFKIYNKK